MPNSKNRMMRPIWLTSAFGLQPSAFPGLLPPISHHGSVNEVIGKFGGADQLRTAFSQLHSILYAD